MSSKSAGLLKGVTHLNHAAIKISAGQTIYFDPYGLSSPSHDADLIFVTHLHSDHLSPQDIATIMKGETVIIAPDAIGEKVKNLGASEVILVTAGKEYTIHGISFHVVPAYNLNKHFHPKANAWVGYVVSINGYSFYIPGDTDLIPEMDQVRADVAFLPVGGTFTMNAEEAARAARIIKPAVAVPIHYGEVVGSRIDAERFIELLKPEIEGVILLEK
jgi:L-ascorbate metabolism protein UlaG (beta-lactamase superfamily)